MGRLHQRHTLQTTGGVGDWALDGWMVGRLKGRQRVEERLTCSLSLLWGGLLVLRWSGLGMVCVLCNQNGPLGPVAVTCLHSSQLSKTLEVVSTSPCGAKTGLSTSKRTPEEMCLSSVLG